MDQLQCLGYQATGHKKKKSQKILENRWNASVCLTKGWMRSLRFGMTSSLRDFHWKPLLTRNVLTSHGACTDHDHPEIVSVYN